MSYLAGMLTIEAEDVRTPDAVELLSSLTRELEERYGDDGGGYFWPEDVETDGGVFAVGRLDGYTVGCSAIRPHAPGVGELKRMYVSPEARGHGFGGMLLFWLEEWAIHWGYERLVLETGTLQPEAIRLYESMGWTLIPPYGPYIDDPRTRCYEKRFDARTRRRST